MFAVSQSCPSAPCHVGLSTGQLTTQQSKQHRSQSHLSPNFSSDIPTLFVVFYLLEARHSVTVILTLTLAHTRGEGFTQGHGYPGVGTFGSCLIINNRSCPPRATRSKRPRSKAQSWRGLESEARPSEPTFDWSPGKERLQASWGHSEDGTSAKVLVGRK